MKSSVIDKAITFYQVKYIEDSEEAEYTLEELMPDFALFNAFRGIPDGNLLSYDRHTYYYFTFKGDTIADVAKKVGCKVEDIMRNKANKKLYCDCDFADCDCGLKVDHIFGLIKSDKVQLKSSFCDEDKLKELRALNCPETRRLETALKKSKTALEKSKKTAL